MKQFDIGVSGSREGMTEKQKKVGAAILEGLKSKGATRLRHGDCKGVDCDAHQMALELGLEVIVHPPTHDANRAFCEGEGVTVLGPRPYLTRNMDIIDKSRVIVAFPKQPKGWVSLNGEPIRGSGTWHVIRNTRAEPRKLLIVVWPDGTYEAHKTGR